MIDVAKKKYRRRNLKRMKMRGELEGKDGCPANDHNHNEQSRFLTSWPRAENRSLKSTCWVNWRKTREREGVSGKERLRWDGNAQKRNPRIGEWWSRAELESAKQSATYAYNAFDPGFGRSTAGNQDGSWCEEKRRLKMDGWEDGRGAGKLAWETEHCM
jgi:hypothetical protein